MYTWQESGLTHASLCYVHRETCLVVNWMMIEVLYFAVAPVDTTKYASMWVGNLPPGTKAKDVLDLLNPHGKVGRPCLVFIDTLWLFSMFKIAVLRSNQTYIKTHLYLCIIFSTRPEHSHWSPLEYFQLHLYSVPARAGSNVIDIEVSWHHTVSVSNIQSIDVTSIDWRLPNIYGSPCYRIL